MNTDAIDIQTLSVGLLVARVVIGLLMAAHGAQKLFGWFGGYGLNKTGEYFVHLGFDRGRGFATAASVSEIAGGLLLALGLFGPVGPALMIAVLIVAMITVHRQHGLFAANNGVELPLVYAAAALGMGLAGPGALSLDAALRITRFWNTTTTAAILALGVVGAMVNLGLRRGARDVAGV